MRVMICSPVKHSMLLLSVLLLLLLPTSTIAKYKLVWSDEFNNASSNAPDRKNWNYDVGGDGWGNNELQFYTSRRKNSYVADGYLYIVARKETWKNRNYTSARIKTQNIHSWKYGKFEARIRLPLAQGSWPAFWMLGDNFASVGWPNCGEIDIMEWVYTMKGSKFAPTNGKVIRAAAHGPGYSFAGDRKANLNGFHVYSVEWTPTQLRYSMDGVNYYNASRSKWVFDHPFFIILNLSIGGWGGSVSPNVKFPINMTVDYVRVYQDDSISKRAAPSSLAAMTVDEATVNSLTVANMTMLMAKSGSSWGALTTITVVDENHDPVPGVAIKGSWSGLVNTNAGGLKTNAAGQVIFQSAKVETSGIIRFCVEGLDKDGYTYVPPSSEECNDIANW